MLLSSAYKPKGLFGGFAPTGAKQTPQVDPVEILRQQPGANQMRRAIEGGGGGFFGEGGTGRALAGYIGDALLQMNGMNPIYQPAMNERRQMAYTRQQQQQQMQMQEQQRQNDWQDWLAKEQWQRDNPKPVNNDTVNDYNFIAQQIGPDAANQYLRNMGDPIVTVPLPNGQIYTGPRSQMGNVMAGGGASQNSDWGDVVDTIPGGVGGNTGGMFPVAGNRLDNITVKAESAGNPNAVSPKGAMGLWQVMPETARDPGFGITPWKGGQADLNRVGSEYRRAMEKRYGGDLAKMWGAYNWGPGNVDAAIAKYGDNWLKYAPAETRSYVALNMRAVRGGK